MEWRLEARDIWNTVACLCILDVVYVLEADILHGNNYVLVDGDIIVGTFSFIIGEEPTYQQIRNGNWNASRPYGTIHRLASNGKAKGIARACFDFCTAQTDYVRIDTHRDNLLMQSAIIKYGFKECGNIYICGMDQSESHMTGCAMSFNIIR